MNSNIPSSFHAGERSIQERLGVAHKMEAVGRRVIRDYMPDQHRTFFEQLPFLVLGAVDEEGAVWATLLEGQPGFAKSPDPRRLCLDAVLAPGDPARAGMELGKALGLLGIELHTRRRNRVNGHIAARGPASFELAVEHSFGNCPKYIQTRQFSFAETPSAQGGANAEMASSLDAEARQMIASADTFFIASYVDVEGNPKKRAVDVSHRGGMPGFVQVEGNTLSVPDYAGNLFFNTLGNLLVNPRAGLLFIDFERGDWLHLGGRVELIFEGEEIEAFEGAERVWRFSVEKMIRRRGASSLRFEFGEFSPSLPLPLEGT